MLYKVLFDLNFVGLVCLQEMSLMLACLKKQEFDQSSCATEIESFSLCCDQQMVCKGFIICI